MKIVNFENREAWLNSRNGKITGTRLKDIIVKRGTGEKIGFYELIAERLSVDIGEDKDETPMDRGTRLEAEGMSRFIKETKKKVNTDLVLWQREDNESIAISPDGFIGEKEAVEIKCLSSSRHIEAYLTQKVPSDYEYQVLQYFIVNEKLEKLYLVFYDPRIPAKDFFFITTKRSDVEKDVEQYLNYQKEKLAEVDRIVNELTNF